MRQMVGWRQLLRAAESLLYGQQAGDKTDEEIAELANLVKFNVNQ